MVQRNSSLTPPKSRCEKLREIEPHILMIRGHRAMLDRDLAVLYEIRAIALRKQVKRNKDRFPMDFMFQLSEEETRILLSQNVIPYLRSLGGFLPYAFSEQGVAMLSSVLTSKRAVQVNIAIMRVFERLREMLATHISTWKSCLSMAVFAEVARCFCGFN